MRALTLKEIEVAPTWATHYSVDDGNYILFESVGFWQRFYKCNQLTRVIKNTKNEISTKAILIPSKEFNASRYRSLNKKSAIAIAKYFELTVDDLK